MRTRQCTRINLETVQLIHSIGMHNSRRARLPPNVMIFRTSFLFHNRGIYKKYRRLGVALL